MAAKVLRVLGSIISAIVASVALAQTPTADEMPKTPEATAALAKMDGAIKRADEAHRQAILNARQQALADLEGALKTALRNQNLDEANRIAAQKKVLEGQIEEIKRAKAGGEQAAPRDGVYISLLGRYFHGPSRKDYPYVNLSIPDGDLWSERIQRELRGKIDFVEIAYEGLGRLLIPADGSYVFDASNCTVKIDGKMISHGMSSKSTVDLKKGVYEVTIFTDTHGGPYLPQASIHIVDERSNKELPLVNSRADIERFMSRAVDGQKVTEMSGWKPSANNLVRVDPSLRGR
jgi:hypothetical protein